MKSLPAIQLPRKPIGKMDKIITNESILRQKSEPTTIEEVRRLDLIPRLRKATKTAWIKGHGLSAIQIGIPIRFAWFRFGKKEFKLLNPEIIKEKHPLVHAGEGCLSLPRVRKDVRRFNQIVYKSNGKIQKAKGLKAFIVQHEIDHMNGLLITDNR